jgi:glycosyltransferase involved in cell wall biosynthesis
MAHFIVSADHTRVDGRMRCLILLILGPTPPPYHGVSVATQALLTSELASHFHLVHVELADRRGIAFVDKPDFHDVLLFVRQWVRLLRALLRKRPAISYLAVSQSTIGFLRDSLFIWPCYLAGSKIVLHLHGGNFRTWYEKCAPWMKYYVRTVLRRVSRIIVLGESLRLLFSGLVPDCSVTVVPNGIAWNRQEPHVCTPSAGQTFRVLHLSTLNRLKGALDLLASIPHVLKLRQDVQFILAGPWSHSADEEEAKRFIVEHRLERIVTFTGAVTTPEQKYSVYEGADIFVFPGVQQEGQPLVALEAMAAGLPVLFTNRGCLRETVLDGVAGLEIRSQDPQHLAERLVWLFDRPEEIARMGKNAHERFLTHYTQRHFIMNMQHALESTMKDVA